MGPLPENQRLPLTRHVGDLFDSAFAVDSMILG